MADSDQRMTVRSGSMEAPARHGQASGPRVHEVGSGMPPGDAGATGRPWRALALYLLVLALATWRGGPPPPVAASAPADAFSADRAHAVLARILGDGAPHPVGTTAVAARIVAELRSLGLEPEEQVLFACSPRATCASVRNLTARLPGREPSAPAVLLSVHHDSVGAGAGAADDGAGVAAALEVVRALQAAPPLRNPVLVLIDDGEEAGLLGAEAFAAQLRPGTIGAVVNLEARGTSGPSFLFETAPGNAWIARTAAAALERPAASSIFYEIYRRLPNDTDFTVWKRAGLQGANFAFVGDVMRYHTVRDDLEHLDRGSLQHHGQNALAMVRAFGEADLGSPGARPAPEDNAVFFDLLSAILVWWPVSWNPVLAAAAGLLIVTAVVRLRRRGLLGGGALAWGVLAFVLAPLAAWLLVSGLLRAVAGGGGLPYPWVAQPAPVLVATWLAALLGALVAGVLCGRRAGAAGAWAGTWLLWLVLAVLAVWRAPGVSYLFLVPALAAGFSALSFRRRGAPPLVLSLLPAALAALLWAGLLLRLYDALGWSVLPVVGALVAVVLGAAAPHWIARAGRPPRLRLALLVMAIVALAAWALGVPHATRERPEKLNLAYLLDVSSSENAGAAPNGAARWIATPERDVLPPELATAAPFERGPSPFPWAPAAFVAPAAPADLAPPVLDLLDSTSEASGRRVRLRIRSQRGAPIVQLAVPMASVTEIVGVGGQALAPSHKAGRSTAEWRVISVQTTPPEGVEIELIIAAAPFEVEVMDRSYGLPPAGAALLAARPEWTSPVGLGDVTVVRRRLAMPDAAPPQAPAAEGAAAEASPASAPPAR